jgi:hypothetical protein
LRHNTEKQRPNSGQNSGQNSAITAAEQRISAGAGDGGRGGRPRTGVGAFHIIANCDFVKRKTGHILNVDLDGALVPARHLVNDVSIVQAEHDGRMIDGRMFDE